jgi:hypothetical protein
MRSSSKIPSPRARVLAICLLMATVLPMPNALAINGGEATSAWPGMGALLVSSGFYCGATLISPSWAMTAAFCVLNGHSQYSFTISPDQLVFPQIGTTVVYTPDIIIIDPDYSPDNAPPALHDVALLHFAAPVLAMPFRINDSPTAIQAGVPAWVVGYGYDAANNSSGTKRIAETSASYDSVSIFSENGAALPNGPCEYDYGDPWSIVHTDGFPLIVGTVTAMTIGSCGGFAYAIPTTGEIAFISSHVTDLCLTSTVGPPCEGIFRHGFDYPTIAAQ